MPGTTLRTLTRHTNCTTGVLKDERMRFESNKGPNGPQQSTKNSASVLSRNRRPDPQKRCVVKEPKPVQMEAPSPSTTVRPHRTKRTTPSGWPAGRPAPLWLARSNPARPRDGLRPCSPGSTHAAALGVNSPRGPVRSQGSDNWSPHARRFVKWIVPTAHD
jgi:hypothetical protein